jgi:hypothetical protein
MKGRKKKKTKRGKGKKWIKFKAKTEKGIKLQIVLVY